MVGANGRGLDDLGEHFAAWRRQRPRGSRIPDHLWQAAVEAARQHGVSQTSLRLGVDYYSLARRLKAKCRAASGRGSMEFVEIPGRVLSASPACVVKLQDGKGLRLRVELRDVGGAESLARSLWRERR